MLNPRNFLLALPLALALGGFLSSGCAANDSEQPDPMENDSAETSDKMPIHSPLYGTWIGDSMIGRFQSLVLMTDHRYHAERPVICVKAPCPPIGEDGTFLLSTQDNHNLIEFNAHMEETRTYEYIVRNDTLYIRRFVEGAEWYFLKPANAPWCAQHTDCDVQNLPVGICSGDYVCTENTCAWNCAKSGDN